MRRPLALATDRDGTLTRIYDLGGQTSLRASWSEYFQAVKAVILVVDSSDRARLGLVKEELGKILQAEASAS